MAPMIFSFFVIFTLPKSPPSGFSLIYSDGGCFFMVFSTTPSGGDSIPPPFLLLHENLALRTNFRFTGKDFYSFAPLLLQHFEFRRRKTFAAYADRPAFGTLPHKELAASYKVLELGVRFGIDALPYLKIALCTALGAFYSLVVIF